MSNIGFTQDERAEYIGILVDEVSGGAEDVATFLSTQGSKAWRIAECSHGCQPNGRHLTYLRAQMNFIELAQGVVRNAVDQRDLSRKAEGFSKLDSYSERVSKSQRTAQGTSCSWSSSTSFQQFLRDSESHDRSRGDSFNAREATSFEVGYDRSRQQASGYASSFDDASTRVDGDGFGFSHFNNYHRSASFSCTSPIGGYADGMPIGLHPVPPKVDLEIPTYPYFLDYLEWNPPSFRLGDFIDDLTGALWATGVAIGHNGGAVTGWASGRDPGLSFVGCPTRWGDECDGPSSGSRSATSFYNIEVQYPVLSGGMLGVALGAILEGEVDFRLQWVKLSLSWSDTYAFSVDYVCTRGQTFTKARSNSHLDYTQENSASNLGRSDSHDQSTTAKDVSRHGEAHSNGQSKSDSVSSGVMDSRGNSRSGADRSAHAEGQSSGQSTAEMRMHAESSGEDSSTSSMTDKSMYYGQLFANLQEMYERVRSEYLIELKVKNVSGAPVVGRWKPSKVSRSMPCSAAHAAFIDRNANLCVRSSCSCGGSGCSSCGSRAVVPGHNDVFAPMPTVVRQ